VGHKIPTFFLIFSLLPFAAVFGGTSDSNAYLQSGITEYQLGHFAEAETLLRNAFELATAQDDKITCGLSLGYLGDTYLTEDRYAEAEIQYERALSVWQKISKTSIYIPETLRNLGAVYSIEHRNEKAVATLNQALRLSNKLSEPHVSLTAQILDTLGMAYFRMGDYKNAESFFVQTMKLRATGSLTDSMIAAVSASLGKIYTKKRKYTEAEAAFRNCLEITMRISGTRHPAVALIRTTLGKLYLDMGRLDEAEAQILESLLITRQTNPILELRVIRTLHLLSDVYVRAGKMEQAQDALAQAAEMARHNLDRDPEKAIVLEAYSDMLKKLGRAQEAESLHTEALRARAAASLVAPVRGVK
jgi:tetratricopeptide (TPR) repeat protein